MFTAAEGRNNFFWIKQVLDGFLEGFPGQRLNKSTAAVGRKFFRTSSLEQFLGANLHRNLIIYCSGFLSKSGNVCPQKVAIYHDFSGFD